MTLTLSGPSLRSTLAKPSVGSHEAVIRLQQQVALDLMARPLGTSLHVSDIHQRYFLVPKQGNSFHGELSIDLMCLPCCGRDVERFDYADMLDAWLSPFVGHNKLETIEMALQSALAAGNYSAIDLIAARDALNVDMTQPLAQCGTTRLKTV